MICTKYVRIQRPSKIHKPEQITSVSEFITLLKQNLKTAGVTSSNSGKILSEYLTGLYLANIPAIIIGESAVNIVNAFSATLCGKVPTILDLAAGFNDYAGLGEIISEQNSDVIIFQNAVGRIDESVYLHLSEDYSEYCFFFISEKSSMLSCLPAGILSYCGLINGDKFVKKVVSDPEYYAGSISFTSDVTEYNPETYSRFFEKLSKLSAPARVSDGYCSIRTKMLTILESTERKYSRMVLFAPELLAYSELWNRKKEFVNSVLDELDSIDDEFSEYIEDE